MAQSLQLLEFLVKNGSERVIDDARQHLSLLRMLRQFHYIDQNGKDQGVNVRNRAQELAKLLSDIDAIRSERKKARANRSKYGGVEGGLGMGGGISGGSRYGGFGSEDAGFGGYRGEIYGDGGGYGGNTSTFQDTQRRGDQFEEYDEEENGSGTAPAVKSTTGSRPPASSALRAASLNTIKRDAKIQKEPEQDLFDFGDEPRSASNANGKARVDSPRAADEFAAMESGTAGDDDFDDFQSATTPGLATEAQRSAFSGLPSPPPATSTIMSSTPAVAPQPVAPAQTSNINDLFASISPSSSSGKPMVPQTPSMSMPPSISSPPSSQANKSSMATSHFSSGPNYYTSVQSTIDKTSTPSVNSHLSPTMSQKQPSSLPSSASAAVSYHGKPASKQSASNTTSSGDAFGSLWSTASGRAGIQNKSAGGAGSKVPDLASMAKAKNEAAIWGSSPTSMGAGVGAGGNGAGTSGVPPRPHAPTPRTASQQPPSQQGSLGGGLGDLLD